MLDAAARWVLERLAEACTPRPRLPIAQWVEQNVRLSPESNSPRPGPLSFADTPYLIAPLSRLDPSDPCRTVNVVASAQSGKSTVGQAWIAWIVGENPGPVGVYLPSIDDARKYAEEKVQAIVDASPALKHRVRQVSSRSNEGSSTLRKRFTGGSLRIATASSPNALQMVSFRDLILEEIAGFDAEVGSRGSPIEQAKNRQEAWETRGAKTLQVSACGVQGACPSTRAHEDGAAYELYLPCPHCAGYNRWEWEDLRGPDKTTGAHFACRLCGGVVEHKHKDAAVKGLAWVATFEDKDDKQNPAPPPAFAAEELERWRARPEKGRQPSFRWWRYVSPFSTWDLLWAAGQKAKADGLAAEKTFWQQTLARAWDEGRDAPDHIKLHELREEYEEGVVPAGAYLLTAGADVQGDHVPWSVYAWGPGGEWWLIDRGKIVGDPAGEEVWKELATVLSRRYPHAEGGEVGVELFGVDTGYKSNHVYKFCGGHPTARAMDGRAGWSFPPIGKPKRVKAKLDGRVVGSTLLYPTGTWSLKSELQYSLRCAIEKGVGVRFSGRGHFHQGVDQDYVRELVAEVLSEDQARGKIVRLWKLRPGFRNEETDIWVIARALAYGLGVGSPSRPFDFEAARAKIMGEAQSDLFAPRRAPGAVGQVPLPVPGERVAAKPPGEGSVVQPPRSDWSTKHKFAARGAGA